MQQKNRAKRSIAHNLRISAQIWRYFNHSCQKKPMECRFYSALLNKTGAFRRHRRDKMAGAFFGTLRVLISLLSFLSFIEAPDSTTCNADKRDASQGKRYKVDFFLLFVVIWC
ncbi:hypothetical protein [Franconibacter helveticus]|uniref:hypothetical protein n=1 Tax=Franconibacter helveticus TaxID=357240 RepID=UPI00290D16E5|nr:hypothetical protein [Franconibacter helveticus]MDU6926986.1 hypothetical protein [Franconibacter helveticus]